MTRPHRDTANIARLYANINTVRSAYPTNAEVQDYTADALRRLNALAAGALPRYIKVPYDWRKLSKLVCPIVLL